MSTDVVTGKSAVFPVLRVFDARSIYFLPSILIEEPLFTTSRSRVYTSLSESFPMATESDMAAAAVFENRAFSILEKFSTHPG